MRKLVFSTINKQKLPFCTLPKYAYVIYEWFFRNLQHYNSRSNWEPTTKLCWRLFRLSNKLCDIKQHLILNSNIKYVTWKYIVGNSTQYDHWISSWYKNKIGILILQQKDPTKRIFDGAKLIFILWGKFGIIKFEFKTT